MTLNGALAGLVAITAGCDAVSYAGAFAIGAAAGIAVVLSIEFIDKMLKIDDPVGAIGVHGVCGALGTILTGVFSVEEGLLYGHGFGFLAVQALGVLSVAAWVAVSIGMVFFCLKRFIGLRVDLETELSGLDKMEHGIESSYADFMPAGAASPGGSVSATDAFGPLEGLRREKAAPFGENRDHAVFTRVSIIFNSLHLDSMKKAMNDIGVTGMTVYNVLGCGMQKGKKQEEYYRGVRVETLDLLPKLQMDVVVTAVPVESVVEAAQRVLHTGRIGDGKIFVSNVQDVVRISTRERGYAALQDITSEADRIRLGGKASATP
jgi:Amt family ammonium transporter